MAVAKKPISKKIPAGSGGRDKRIAMCPCAKPVVTKAFTASQFTGQCCVECLEIISYRLITDEDNQVNSGGIQHAGPPSSNEEIG